VKVETSPSDVGVVTVPTGVPPLHGVDGSVSLHKVKATDPVGAPAAALPVTVAVSFHELPTAGSIGAITVVVSVGVAGVTPSAPADGLCSAQKLKATTPMIADDTTLRTNVGQLRNRHTSAGTGPRRPIA
jgi:hypothetical protein